MTRTAARSSANTPGPTPDARTLPAGLLARTLELAEEYLDSLPERHVGALADAAQLVDVVGGPLAEEGVAAQQVIEELARDVEPGLVASAGPRYFGFVIGGALPASLAADWLTATWDQNAVLHAASPAAAAVEQVAGEWMKEVFGLPPDASIGLPTGAGLGNAVGLAAARHAVLARAGWDVETRGLYGAPVVEVLIGDEAHATVLTSLQYLGLGRERVRRIEADDQGRMRADRLALAIEGSERPTIVITQAGNVNTGAFDPMNAIADAMAGHPNAWIHVDGAFGLWAAASPHLEHLVAGVERADSWSTDAHKWLNIGYDCGFVAVRDSTAHRAAMAASAAYLMQSDASRDNWEYVLDSSRRARGFALYAALRSLGRSGVRDLVERCCALARRMAERLALADGVGILNDVVLNQVLARFDDDDERTRDVIRRVQDDGTCWLGGTQWQGRAAMRVSVSNWSTSEQDIDRSAHAILEAFAASRRSTRTSA